MRKNIGFLLATSALSLRTTFEGAVTFDFPETVDDINAVPEKARGLYVEKEGKWTYQDTGALRNSLQNAKNERDAARRQAANITKWEKLGKSPEEIEQLVAQAAQAEADKLTQKGDWEGLKVQMETNHNTALAAKDDRINKLMKALEKKAISDAARAALASPDVEGNPLFLLPAISGRVKLEETDDDFVPVVLREDGSPMLNAQNQPATLKDLFLEFKGREEWAGAFKGLNQSGGGASGNGGGGGGGVPGDAKRSAMTPLQKVQYIKEHGQAKYEALPW